MSYNVKIQIVVKTSIDRLDAEYIFVVSIHSCAWY